MKHLSRPMAAATAAVALFTLAACSDSSDGSDASPGEVGGTLVVYTPNEQNMLDALIPAFEAETGVTVELITAGTGELYQRIRSEAANPQGDVLFGGGDAQAKLNADLWEEYVSPNDAEMLDAGKNIGGFFTPYQADGSNLLVNTEIVGDIEIDGYEDLLNPELKGKIAFGDATQSSSAFAQLTNMLKAVGGDYESDEGWDYVEALVQNLDGKLIGSSSQVAQDVANGEFIVALTYEPLSLNFVNSGAPVEIVYPEEGAVFLPAGVQLIKGGPNQAAGEAFIDFLTSEAGQTILANETSSRPLRDGIVAENLTPLDQITVIDEDSEFVSENREEIVARFQTILEANL